MTSRSLVHLSDIVLRKSYKMRRRFKEIEALEKEIEELREESRILTGKLDVGGGLSPEELQRLKDVNTSMYRKQGRYSKLFLPSERKE